MRDFLVKWQICKKKTRDFRFNGGFEKRKHVIFALNWGFAKRKARDFCITGDLQRENACFFFKCKILDEKTRDFRLNGGFSKRKRVIVV